VAQVVPALFTNRQTNHKMNRQKYHRWLEAVEMAHHLAEVNYTHQNFDRWQRYIAISKRILNYLDKFEVLTD
jgi:hypothetical protein